jgi:hypothetical protein
MVGIFAFMFFAVTTMRQQLRDFKPESVRFEGQSVVVYNKRGEELWRRTVAERFNLRTLSVDNSKVLSLSDIDGDGTKEIITVMNFIDDSLNDKSALFVYKGDGTLKWKKNFGREVSYLGRKYQMDFRTEKLIVDLTGKKIFISLLHTHSPSALYALDVNGNSVGELWNYGHIQDFVVSEEQQTLTAVMLDDETNEPLVVSFAIRDHAGLQQFPSSRLDGFPSTSAVTAYIKLKADTTFTSERAVFKNINRSSDNRLMADLFRHRQWEYTFVLNEDLSLYEILHTDLAVEKYGIKNVEKMISMMKKSIICWKKREKPI